MSASANRTSNPPRGRGLLFTGTDTGVGKTVITCAVARQLRRLGVRLGVCKPVATGGAWHDGRCVSDDAVSLARSAGCDDWIDRVCPRVFPDPVAPPVAAARQGVELTLAEMLASVDWWYDQADVVLVEGVGGLMCPLTRTETVADLAAALGWPLVVVARNTLGTINHSLLTLTVAADRGLPVAGLVLNEVEPPRGTLAEQSNAAELQQRSRVPLLAQVRHRSDPWQGHWPEIECIDWLQLSNSAGGQA